MKISLEAVTNSFKEIEEILQLSQAAGRVCKSKKDFRELRREALKPKLIGDVFIRSGHHSVFEHVWLGFYMEGIPKALAMILNNERQYSTSEKSARFTVMEDMDYQQRELYNKWGEKLKPLIEDVAPNFDNSDTKEKFVAERCQENARYMTSVFTPTKMFHTINLRQLNFLMREFKNRSAVWSVGDIFKRRLSESMDEFLGQEHVNSLWVEGLENQTDRHLSFFGPRVEEHFGDTYSTNYTMSFAGLAQAHRHRTIGYRISGGTESGRLLGFYIPKIVSQNQLSEEWLSDIKTVSEKDAPQGQKVMVAERGFLEDFRSKAILRLCGHAQYEIMKQTLETAELYAESRSEVRNWIRPKCTQGMKCAGACAWGSDMALSRVM